LPSQQQSERRRYEGTALEDLLQQVRTEHGDDVEILEANRLRKGGLGGFFAKEAFEVVVGVPADDTGEPKVLSVDEGLDAHDQALAADDGEGDFVPLSLLELAERVSDAERVGLPVEATARPLVTFEATLDRELGRWPTADAIAAAEAIDTPVARPIDVPASASALPTAPVASAPTVPAPSRISPSLVPALSLDVLERIGVPLEMARRPIGGSSLVVELYNVLDGIAGAESLPTAPGSIICVVGPREEAMDLAHDLAREVRVAPESLVLASTRYRGRAISGERRIRDAAEAEDQRRRWRRRRTPVFVAIDAEMSRTGTAWAREVLDALEPSMAWASVAATRKAEDIDAWVDELGGIDALAVTALDDTTSPAAVLRSRVPVGRIGTVPASRLAWATMLAERLAA
jgi:hypothetical protein